MCAHAQGGSKLIENEIFHFDEMHNTSLLRIDVLCFSRKRIFLLQNRGTVFDQWELQNFPNFQKILESETKKRGRVANLESGNFALRISEKWYFLPLKKQDADLAWDRSFFEILKTSYLPENVPPTFWAPEMPKNWFFWPPWGLWWDSAQLWCFRFFKKTKPASLGLRTIFGQWESSKIFQIFIKSQNPKQRTWCEFEIEQLCSWNPQKKSKFAP